MFELILLLFFLHKTIKLLLKNMLLLFIFLYIKLKQARNNKTVVEEHFISHIFYQYVVYF